MHSSSRQPRRPTPRRRALRAASAALLLALAAGCTEQARIVGLEGQALLEGEEDHAGVTVRLVAGGGVAPLTATTNRLGLFRFERVSSEARYRLEVTRAGYRCQDAANRIGLIAWDAIQGRFVSASGADELRIVCAAEQCE